MRLDENINKKLVGLVAILLITFNLIQAQNFNLVEGESKLTILGTSSLHDWNISAEKQSGKIVFKNLATCEIEKFTVDVVAESLKSGKPSMDKKTYAALKTNSYKTISYVLVEVKETITKGDGKIEVHTQGDLTISGVKKRVSLDFILISSNNKISLIGEKKLKMTDYNIDPPKAMLGIISTGDEITLKFSTIFK